MMGRVVRVALMLACGLLAARPGSSQQPVPQPFPTPAAPAEPSSPSSPPASPPSTPRDQVAPSRADDPSEATLGVPLYPGVQFLASYDAGKGQRYYLFGAVESFFQIVAYYRSVLKQKGELVFDAPATHTFDLAKFKEETMAFQPSVTVKDYTWNGSEGYLNPKRGGQPAHFPTVIQIVPIR